MDSPNDVCYINHSLVSIFCSTAIRIQMGKIDANMDHDLRNLPKENIFPSSRSYLPLSRAATDPIDYYSKGNFFTERHSFSKLKAALRQHYQKPAKRSSSIQTDPKELSATNASVIDSDQSNAGTFSSAGGVGQAPDRASRGRLTRFESAFERLRAISKDGHYSLRKLLATEDDPSPSDIVLHATSILELDHGKRPERCSPQPKKRALSLETDLAMIGAFAEDFKDLSSHGSWGADAFAKDVSEYETLFPKTHSKLDMTPYHRSSF